VQSNATMEQMPIREMAMYFLDPHPNARMKKVLDGLGIGVSSSHVTERPKYGKSLSFGGSGSGNGSSFTIGNSNGAMGASTSASTSLAALSLKKKGSLSQLLSSSSGSAFGSEKGKKAKGGNGKGLTIDSIASLTRIYASDSLRSLDVSGLSTVAEEGILSFLSSYTPSYSEPVLALTSLTLSSHTPITSLSLSSILSRAPGLRKLNLRGLPKEAVNDGLFGDMAKRGFGAKLEGLDVRRCWGISAGGIRRWVRGFADPLALRSGTSPLIEREKPTSRMKYLRLGGLPVSLALMKDIGRRMGATLQVLDLQGSGVCDGHLEALVDLSEDIEEEKRLVREGLEQKERGETRERRDKIYWNDGVGAGALVLPFRESGHRNGELDNPSQTSPRPASRSRNQFPQLRIFQDDDEDSEDEDEDPAPISASQTQRTHYTRLVLPRLRHLNLSSNTDLTDRGLVYITGCIPKLEMLELSDIGEGMGEEGVVKLLNTTREIRKVDVEGASVGDGVVEALCGGDEDSDDDEATGREIEERTPGYNLDTLLLSHTAPTTETLFTLLESRPSLHTIAIDGTSRVSQSFIREFIKLKHRRGVLGAEINAIDCRCVAEGLLREFGVNGNGWDGEDGVGSKKKGKGKGWIRARRGERSFEGAVVVGYVDASCFEEANGTNKPSTPPVASGVVAIPSPDVALPLPSALPATSSKLASHSRTSTSSSTSQTPYEDECDPTRIVLKCFWSWQSVDGYTSFLRDKERERRKAGEKGKKRRLRARARGLGGALGREDSDEDEGDGRCVIM
jgi:hypothetical protein